MQCEGHTPRTGQRHLSFHSNVKDRASELHGHSVYNLWLHSGDRGQRSEVNFNTCSTIKLLYTQRHAVKLVSTEREQPLNSPNSGCIWCVLYLEYYVHTNQGLN